MRMNAYKTVNFTIKSIAGLVNHPHRPVSSHPQEARRLIIAVWQNIAYEEYLQVILGSEAFRDNLLGADQGGYDPTINPDIANEFATAAFRFGHTEIPEKLPFSERNYHNLREVPLNTVRPVNGCRRFMLCLA